MPAMLQLALVAFLLLLLPGALFGGPSSSPGPRAALAQSTEPFAPRSTGAAKNNAGTNSGGAASSGALLPSNTTKTSSASPASPASSSSSPSSPSSPSSSPPSSSPSSSPPSSSPSSSPPSSSSPLLSLFGAKPPAINATDAALSAAATRAAFAPGVEGYRSLMCGSALNSATLNCSAFGSCGPPATPYPSELFACPVIPGTELLPTAAGAGANQTGSECLQLQAPPQDQNAGGPSGCFTCAGGVSTRLADEGIAAGRRPLRCLTTATAVVVGGWPRERPGGPSSSSSRSAPRRAADFDLASSPNGGTRSRYSGEDLDLSEGDDSLDDERTSGVDWRCVGDSAHLFYHMQSSGALSPEDRERIGAWRGDTLLNDTVPATGAPLVGGFLDAADVAKFVFPLAYSLSVLAYGAFVGPARGAYAVDAMRRDDLVSILARGCDFLVAARYDTAGGIVAYTTAKGNLTQSHTGFWGRAEDIDVPSDVGYLVPGKPSADLAGAVSAALSLCAFALASAADASALVAAEDSSGSSSAAAVSAAAARFTRLRDGRSALDVAGTYLSVAADLHAQAEASPGLHTPHVDSMLPDFYNSTSYLDDVALAGAALALTTGGSTSVGFRRSNAAAAANNASSGADADGVTVLTSGVSAAAAAALRARADEISAARGTPRLRAPEDYWRAGRAARRAWLKTPQAQTNTLSWDNVGPLAGNMMARTALSSAVANISISRSGARGFESPEAMLNYFTAPAQVAVLSWIATAKHAPARILGSLAGFGDKVQYIPQGGLAVAYKNAWGNARLLSGATTLALDLADLAGALGKATHRSAWRCWARSQARSLMGRLPRRTTTSSPDAAALAAAAAAALAPVGRARPPLWRSFVVGLGPGAPRFLSHRGASCPADRALPCDCSAYASPYPNPTTIWGALVGGPNVAASSGSGPGAPPGFFGFFDSREKYTTTEPALDYNAGWLVTTMALAGIDEPAPQPGSLAATMMSSASKPIPVSQNAANSDADAWDSCFDAGLGTFPRLPRAFVADLHAAAADSIASSRFAPHGTGILRKFKGWSPDGAMLMAAGLAAVAAVLALSSAKAAGGGLSGLLSGGCLGGGLGGGRLRKPSAAARAAAAEAAAKNGGDPALAAAAAAAVLAAASKPLGARQQWFDGAVRLAAARDDVAMLDLLERYAGGAGVVGSSKETAAKRPRVVFDPNAALPDGFTALLAAAAAATAAPSPSGGAPPSSLSALPAPLPSSTRTWTGSSQSLPDSAAAAAAAASAAAVPTVPTAAAPGANSSATPATAAAAPHPPAPAFLQGRAAAAAAAAPAGPSHPSASWPSPPPPLPGTAVEFLLSRGADPRARKRDGWGDSALHYAAAAGNAAAAAALARAAPELLSSANFAGRTPADAARAAGRAGVAAALDALAEELGPISALRSGTGLSARRARRARRAASMRGDQSASSLAADLEATTGDAATDATKKLEALPQPQQQEQEQPVPLPVAATTAQAAAAAPRNSSFAPLTRRELALVARFADRGRDGWGSVGTVPARGLRKFRAAAAVATACWALYLTWRALRTLNDSSDAGRYAYSVVFWLVEFSGFCFWGPLVVCLWRQVERPPRNLRRMLALGPRPTPSPSSTSASSPSKGLGLAAGESLYLQGTGSAGGGGGGGSIGYGSIGGGGGGSLPYSNSFDDGNWGGGDGDAGSAAAAKASTPMPSSMFPSAALLVTCYSEPVEIIEPTVIAALQQDYPPDRVHVCVCCDDPRRTDIPAMVEAVRATFARHHSRRGGAGGGGGEEGRSFPRLSFLARPKVPGVAHHAKAGNVNSALFAAGVSETFVVVLDCDMLTDPKFLARTLGHFLERGGGGGGGSNRGGRGSSTLTMTNGGGGDGGGSSGNGADAAAAVAAADSAAADPASGGPAASLSRPLPRPARSAAAPWRLKPRTGFLQVPQAFVNIPASDPLCHRSRLFFGPLQAGRDGADAVCCCGTGCVFDRAALVSVGGQAYGSITEDNLTSQALAAAGFSSMYLDENLQAGLAPDDVPGVFEQRLRWATGALQILARDNPLSRRGLAFAQRLLYFDASAYALQSFSTLVLVLVPLVFLFTGVTPFAVREMWELLAGFGLFYVAQRAALWIAHLRIEGGTAGAGVAGAEMLRTTQIGYWLAPSNVRAVLTVFWHELKRALTPKGKETEDLAFKVTKKGGGSGSSASSDAGGSTGGSSSAATVVSVSEKGPPAPLPAAGKVDFTTGDHAALRAAFSSEISAGGGVSKSALKTTTTSQCAAPAKEGGGGGRGAPATLDAPEPVPAAAAPPPPPQPSRAFDRLKAVLASASDASARVATSAGEALPYLWFHWLYFLAVAVAVAFTVVRAAKGRMDDWDYAVTAVALGWSALVCSQLWPPVSLLLPEHLRSFRQLVLRLLTCSCLFSGRGAAAERARRRRRRQRRRMRRYYKSSGETSITDDDEDGDGDGDDDSDDDSEDDDETDSGDDDSRYSEGGGGSGGKKVGSKAASSFGEESAFGSVAPGREQRRRGDAAAAAAAGAMARSSGSRGSRDTLASAGGAGGGFGGGGSFGDLSSSLGEVPTGPRDDDRSAAAAAARGGEQEDEKTVATVGPSTSAARRGEWTGSGRLLRRSNSSLRRGAALAGEARVIATLLVPTPASFAIWLIDLFVLGALIAAAVIDAKRAEIALHKMPLEY